MTPALVVIEDVDRDRNLLERARAFAVGEETDLGVLALATPSEYDSVAETLEAIGDAERTSYDEDDVVERISGDVDGLAADVLGETVDYELSTEIAVADQAETVIDVRLGRTDGTRRRSGVQPIIGNMQ